MDVRHVAQLLDISVDHLDSFVKCIGSGGIGKKRDDSWIPNPEPYDTQSTSPVVVITYSIFTTPTLDTNQMHRKT